MAGGTFGEDGDDDIISGINVTPLVDITLVLLIIFMVTATYIVKETIEVDLPEAANAGETVQTTLALVLDKEGRLFLNGKPVTEAELQAQVPALRAEAQTKDETLQAIIAADRSVTHGQVVHLIDVVKGLGITRFAINIERDEASGTTGGGG